MLKFFEGRLMTCYGVLVRIRGSHFLPTGQLCYDLDLPWPGGVCAYGTAVEGELKLLVGTLPFLLYYIELGHCVCYLPGGIMVRRDRDDFYRVVFFLPLSSDSVYYGASTLDEVLSLVGEPYASSSQWEL